MVAAPGNPGNAVALDQLERAVPVDLAYVGSCNGGKRDDIERAHEVVRWALDRGLMLPLRVQLFVQMGSDDVRRHAEAQGWIADFEEAGARVLSPGCGACIHAGPGMSTRPDQVTVGAFNRNFPGRSGPGPVWLASAATVAASAFRGRLCSFKDLQAFSPVTGG
jgi:3-isopropylmalate/(R)-2-methylmalate dehydratase large subunit